MKTNINATASDMSKTHYFFEKETSDMIIDSFNEQVSLIKEFKQKTGMIKPNTNRYPDYGLELQKTIDAYLESSHELLMKNMKKKLDVFSVVEEVELKEHENSNRQCRFPNTTGKKTSDDWIYDYIEQVNFFRPEVKALAVNQKETTDFYFYADINALGTQVYAH